MSRPTLLPIVVLLVCAMDSIVRLQSVHAQEGEAVRRSRCPSWRSCRECITSDPLCSWCSQEKFANLYPRCDDSRTLRIRNCSSEHLIAPESSISLHKDLPLSHTKQDDGRGPIQLKPQKLHLKVRPKLEIRFNVSFRQAKNYPVDLYFLMDLTSSMEDDREQLADLGQRLVESMRGITTNFRLGFGSFVDKVVMPYVDTFPSKLINPCPDNRTCEAPYGFRNHMSLSNDTQLFTLKVKEAKTSANLDDAEGGFDALMQVVVCRNEIRWDGRSRKIVVFATDSGFHYAGDGKLGGIVKPNDESCHLDSKGLYTESTNQDYPSLSQINRIIRDSKTNLIFAVPKEVLPTYDRLSAAIEGASTSRLESDSSNIVDLISSQYEKIRSEVILTDDAPPGISVKYRSKCLGSDKMKDVNRCGDLNVGDTVVFEVRLLLERCPVDRANWSHVLHIHPVGLNEVLEINLDMFCECDCEKPEMQESLSKACSFMGTYLCGICNCSEGQFGRNCECNNTDVSRDDNWGNCRPENSTVPCFERGDCTCGDCDCHQPLDPEKRVYGKHCECDNFSCDRGENEKICGGQERGECDCGKCVCEDGWEGPTCGCSKRRDTCTSPSGLELCSGNGKCVCGRCECFETKEGTFGGPYCEECPTCKGKCVEFKSCVECQAFGQGPLSQEECKNCTFQPEVVKTLQETPADRKCIFLDDEGCSFMFTYNFDKNRNPTVMALLPKECPKLVDATALGIGIAVSVLVIGLAILFILRLCLYLKDNRAYARFMEEKKKEVWKTDENPLYKKANINYANPIYGQSS